MDEDGLQLDISLIDDSGSYHANDLLVGVVGELTLKEVRSKSRAEWGTVVEHGATLGWRAPEVPDSAACPLMQVLLSKDEQLRPIPITIDAEVSDTDQISKRAIHPRAPSARAAR